MQELELVMGLQGTVNGGHLHEERVDRLRQLAFQLSAQRTGAGSDEAGVGSSPIIDVADHWKLGSTRVRLTIDVLRCLFAIIVAYG